MQRPLHNAGALVCHGAQEPEERERRQGWGPSREHTGWGVWSHGAVSTEGGVVKAGSCFCPSEVGRCWVSVPLMPESPFVEWGMRKGLKRGSRISQGGVQRTHHNK